MNIIHPSSMVNDLELTATVPIEMINAQQQLITWCDGKLKALRFESDELKGAYEHAQKMKWKYTTIKKHFDYSLKQISYYEKIKAALLEGFYIVPNFPIQMFAIKTKIKNPSGYETSTYSYYDLKQSAQELSINEGEYQNPFPIVKHLKTKSGDGTEYKISSAQEWDDFEFPITMARPQVMEATSRAMALKIFDQIGIMPAHKKEDPVIIGQILSKKNSYTDKVVSFMVAWHLNTNVL